MAQKRMFDRAIIDTDKFMDLSMSSKALYFLLGMEADDEGFVSFKKVMRIHGGNEDDIKILVAKSFLIMFESGVVVITDWNTNNWLDSRRTRPTEYQKEKRLLELTESNKYVLSNRLDSIEEYRIEQKSIEENISDEESSQKSSKKSKSKIAHNPLGSEIIKAFESIDPKNKTYYGNKTQRQACDFLIEEYGLDQVLDLIPKLEETNRKSFYQITTPWDMKEKITKVFNDIKRATKTSPYYG